ncbi:hypothetical protein WDU94_010537 [Cyamophila willieti]
MDPPTCSCDYQDSAYIASSCGNSLNVTLFMTLVDVMLRTSCDLADPCGRASSNRVRNIPMAPEYDFIVVGGGVAGPVVAGRLAENLDWKVLLLEAGPDEPTLTTVPGFAASAVGTHLDWKYETEKNKNACLATKGVCQWPRGKMLAGTGAMTGMMYTRSHPSIYDEWKNLGNPGWGWSDVLPYFIKSEGNLNPDLVETSYHGFDGPLKVQRFKTCPPLGNDIIAAGRELGYSSPDFNGANQIGVNIAQVMVDNGVRSSTPRMYLRDKYTQGNLKVQLNSHVMKINIDPQTKQAQSVQFKDTTTGEIKTVKAKKEIILTAGAIGSPQLLMLSGVGPKAHLDELGIDTIKDLRVGYNLIHHVGVNLKYTIEDNDLRSLDLQNLQDYLSHRNGSLSNTGLTQLTGFFKSSFSEIRDIQVFFDGYTTACSHTGYNEECNNGKLMNQPETKVNNFMSKVQTKYKSNNQNSLEDLIRNYFEKNLLPKLRKDKSLNFQNDFDVFLNALIQFDEKTGKQTILSNQLIKSEIEALMEDLGGFKNVQIDKSISIPMADEKVKNIQEGAGLQQRNQVPVKFQTNRAQLPGVSMDDEINELIQRIGIFIEKNNKPVNSMDFVQKRETDVPNVPGTTKETLTDTRPGRSILSHPFNGLFNHHKEENKMPCGRRSIYARPTNLLPISRGRLFLRSNDPFDYPIIHSNYLNTQQDIDVLIEGIRIVQGLTRARALRKWDFRLDTTEMPKCKNLRWDSDAYWECYITMYTLPENHPGGTCRMGPASDYRSVVDSDLSIHGVSRLRVMDASVFPTNINSNPIATIIMIAEKGADMLKETWE